MPHPTGEPPPDEQERLEEERVRREAEELRSFERRADWWRRHYGGTAPDEAEARTREALEQAERMPSESAERAEGDDGPE